MSASQLNILRDDLNETAPAKATAAGQIFAATGANAIAARTPTVSTVAAGETTTSTSYTNLATAGPSITVTTGTGAIVWWRSIHANNTAAAECLCGVAVSGASSAAASDITATIATSASANQRYAFAQAAMFGNLTAGSNTFTMQYRVSAGTGTFTARQMVVLPL